MTLARQKWRKLGLTFRPSGQQPWMVTHSSNPVTLHRGGDVYRMYFSCRNADYRSYVGYVDLRIGGPDDIEVIKIADQPVLSPGPLGHFDDYGIYSSSVIEHGGQLIMYYIGYNAGPRKPMFYTGIGIGVSDDGGDTFRKLYKAPILQRSEHDPWMASAPRVLVDNGVWRMWYLSGQNFEQVGDEMVSYYHVKYAESRDGIHWERNGVRCLDHARNFSRASVQKENDGYKAWYSFNAGEGYRIGYSESADGIVWTPKDDLVDLPRSESGWDSEALAYPWVFTHGGRRYMAYCGNQYGRDGFGMAVLESE